MSPGSDRSPWLNFIEVLLCEENTDQFLGRLTKFWWNPKKTLESSHKWQRPSNKLRYAEVRVMCRQWQTCDALNNTAHISYKWFFIVVSNYGFAFTNQFSRCSAINFRANWDICCCSGAQWALLTSHHITPFHITSFHITSHQGRQEGTKGLHHNNWCGQTCDLPSLGFDPFKQVKVLEERTHLMTHQWCGTSKRRFY